MDALSLNRDEIIARSRSLGHGRHRLDISTPAVHCGGCMRTIENGLAGLSGVEGARVNLSTRRVLVQWDEARCEPASILRKLDELGFEAHIADSRSDEQNLDLELRSMVRCLAVSGFAAANVMLLSVSVWSGAEPETRNLFHWLSALIAVPSVVYAGRPFFVSAWGAVRARRLNMDVPISLAVISALAMSLYETLRQGEHTYFDASVTLLFFLLIGRTLDHLMREKARGAVKGLMLLSPHGAVVVADDNTRDFRPIDEIEPGMRLAIAPGERVPVDAEVLKGRSDVDCSLVTGESAPEAVGAGSMLLAGSLNLTGSLTLKAASSAANSFLGEMVHLMEAAEAGQVRYRRLADRAADIYAPTVHIVAVLTFAGWLLATGDWHFAILTGIAVLIITCPCALGLAIPIVQVVASSRLFQCGVMMKDGQALERLAGVDTVVFDKTGTVTFGKPQLGNAREVGDVALARAAGLALHSLHPLSRAILAAAQDMGLRVPEKINAVEHPGQGLEAEVDGKVLRLGKRAWSGSDDSTKRAATVVSARSEVVLSEDGRPSAVFWFEDIERTDARETVGALLGSGYAVELMSGDRRAVVETIASRLGIEITHFDLLPSDKVARIDALKDRGHKVLMAGDGLNDGPALLAADVSIAPGAASDISRKAADFVFIRDSLEAVTFAIGTAKRTRVLIMQNLVLATVYNLIAVPVAVLGFATPLVAAIAMSASSVVVTLNALRLHRPEVAKPEI